jgi:hypothetical protein
MLCNLNIHVDVIFGFGRFRCGGDANGDPNSKHDPNYLQHWKSSAANNSDHVSNSDQNLNSKLSISYSNLVIMIFTFKFHKIKQCLYVGALILNHISRI